ncbi:MAG: hypothetical protein E6J17_07410 [Chloroflexi bacterium]|nr:MAG: hypothetical protein E6J17_07410 [Chloroflexota bacterium]
MPIPRPIIPGPRPPPGPPGRLPGPPGPPAPGRNRGAPGPFVRAGAGAPLTPSPRGPLGLLVPSPSRRSLMRRPPPGTAASRRFRDTSHSSRAARDACRCPRSARRP